MLVLYLVCIADAVLRTSLTMYIGNRGMNPYIEYPYVLTCPTDKPPTVVPVLNPYIESADVRPSVSRRSLKLYTKNASSGMSLRNLRVK